MAQGDLILFDEFAKSIADGRIDLNDDTFNIALTTLQVGATAQIAKTDPVPQWTALGSPTSDLSADEVTPGGGYSAGGIVLTSVTWTQTSGVGKFDADNVVWTSSASGDPATIKSAIIYSDTATNKDAIGYIDMTADGTAAISLLAGDVSVTFNAGGIFTLTNP